MNEIIVLAKMSTGNAMVGEIKTIVKAFDREMAEGVFAKRG